MSESEEKLPVKWHLPMEVMKLHNAKMKKKKALQARLKGNLCSSTNSSQNKTSKYEDILSAKKRKNPFLVDKQCDTSRDKKNKTESPPVAEDTADQTLFNLLHRSDSSSKTNTSLTSFNNILNKSREDEACTIVKATGELNAPIDWALKSRLRFLSEKPFPWSSKLKISEETSGLVSFIRCLVDDTNTTLDTSPNSKFHQCCLYWQAPHLPWLTLFPRNAGRATDKSSFPQMNAMMREQLHISWTDSLRSLFHLLRTRHCPFFYVCANTFTVLFRAAGINGFSEIHALITPSTRGLRQMLRQEDIEFTLPLKKKRMSDQGYDTQDSTVSEGFGGESECYDNALPDDDDEEIDDQWFKSLGIAAEDIKRINSTEARISQKNECQIDNGEQSLILVQGIEVLPLYNYLINCKSATSNVGQLAGVPPTLLAPVAFAGGTLQSLRTRERKLHVDDNDYYCLDLLGPILPTLIHNLFTISPPEHNTTVTCVNIPSTIPFTKVNLTHAGENKEEEQGKNVFGKENLSDCGLNSKVLKHFCTSDSKWVDTLECLKYTSDNGTFIWT